MDVLVLCGGKGTRLAQVVSDVPKPLAPVLGRPFLDYVLDFLAQSGLVCRFVLLTGHLGQLVEQRYGDQYQTLPIRYSFEETPLGTGGAVLQALRHGDLSSPFLLVNGDSFVDIDLRRLLEHHTTHGNGFTLATFLVEDAARFGTVELQGGRVVAFREKSGLNQPGAINAGVYVVAPPVLDPWRDRNGMVSLETEILPALVRHGKVSALATGTRFIDIGLPETYSAASGFFVG